jgi:AraC-like DNA-binding protein
MAAPVVDEYVVRRPVLALRHVLDAYSGYRQAGITPALHRGLPSPYVTVIFTLDDQLHMAQHTDPTQPPGSYDSLVGGLHTTPALIRHDGAQSGVQLQLSPLWARRLFGLPAGELAGIDVHAADLLGRAAADIQDRLRAARGWPARFAVLDQALLELLDDDSPHGGVQDEVVYAWNQLRRTNGTASIAGLSRETGWSDRHLANRFRQETGLAPKAAARVIRFDAARRQLQRGHQAGTRIPMADVAAERGYYDQSHLVREFTALSGCTPTRWLVSEFGAGAQTPHGQAPKR